MSTPKAYWAAVLTESAGRFVPADERILLVRRPSVWWILFHRWPLLVIPAALLLAVHFAFVAATGTRPPLSVTLFGKPWVVSLPVLALLWALLVLEYQVLAWLSRLYVLTERRMFAVAGIVARDAGEVPLANIQHDVVTQSTWERVLNLGTVGVATAGGDGPVLRWLSVPNPDRVLSALRGAIDRGRSGGRGEAAELEGATARGAGGESGGVAGGVSVLASGSLRTVDVVEPMRLVGNEADASRPVMPMAPVVPSAGTSTGLSAGHAFEFVATSEARADAAKAVPQEGRVEMAWCPVIGIAGGIGSGKSAVAAAFQRLGCVVIDSDKEAKAALDRADVRLKLAEWWGPGVLLDSGGINRKAVADVVFANPAERRRLEELIHPLIRARRGDLKERAKAAGAAGVIVDAPLLFEAGVDAECDLVVFVDAPREQRLARVRSTRGWEGGELDRREASQMALDEKRARSSLVVMNDGTQAELEGRVAAAWAEILELRPRIGSN